MSYQIIKDEYGNTTVTYFSNGRVLITDQNNPNFGDIVARLTLGSSDGVEDLFSPESALRNAFAEFGDVRIEHGVLYFKGEAVHSALADRIVDSYEQGNDDWKAWVNFMTRLFANPNEHSRRQLYRWLQNGGWSINKDGNLLAYKAVQSDFGSVHAGPGYVNGKLQNGHLDNSPGNIVTMDRPDVTFDPYVGCAEGLHAGVWSYAYSFKPSNGRILLVEIDPADVVSIPTDSSDQKMRVSKYRVVMEVKKPYESILVNS